jgi:hypothetical protein
MVPHTVWHNAQLEAEWLLLEIVRGEVNRVIEAARQEKHIGSALGARVHLSVSTRAENVPQNPAESFIVDTLKGLGGDLHDLFGTSSTTLGSPGSSPVPQAPSSAPAFHHHAIAVISSDTLVSLLKTAGTSVDTGRISAVEIAVHVLPAAGCKCPRCWRFVSPIDSQLCHRCALVMSDNDSGDSSAVAVLR